MKRWIPAFAGMTILISICLHAFAATGVVVEQSGGLYFVTPKGQKIIPKMGDEFYDGYQIYNTKNRAFLLLFYGELIELKTGQNFQVEKNSVKPKPYFPPPYTALEDAINVAKMGPVGIKAPLNANPPKGGMEGLYPIYGNILPSPQINFQWTGKDVLGKKPTFFFFEEAKEPKYKTFPISKKTKSLAIASQELGLQEGKTYHWFLGRLEKWPKAQSQVFTFQILSQNDQKQLNKDLKNIASLGLSTKEGENFLKANLFYHYQMFDDMINLLKPMYQKRTSRGFRRLLYLGYVRLGRYAMAKRYEEKN